MTKRTRYFLIGSVAFLVIGLAVGLVAYYGGIPGAFAAERRAPGAALRPEGRGRRGLRQRAGADELAVPPARQGARAAREADAARTSCATPTGIDVERDIDYVVAYMMADPRRTARSVARCSRAAGSTSPASRRSSARRAASSATTRARRCSSRPRGADDTDAPESPARARAEPRWRWRSSPTTSSGSAARRRSGRRIDLEHGQPNVTGQRAS